MRRLLPLALIAICISSCSTYYYSTVASNNPNFSRNDKREFVADYDSVCITYSFFGENAPITISILNRTNHPIYVSWEESSLIVNNSSSSYLDNNAHIDSKTISRTYSYGSFFNETHSYTNTAIKQPQSVSFIPPKSEIEHTPIQLANFDFEKIPNSEYKKSTFGASSGPVNVKERTFSEEETPLQLRSYLTLYSANPSKDGSKSTAFEHTFYLSGIIKTSNVNPSELLSYNHQMGDFFYIKKVKGNGVGKVLGVIAITTAAVAADVAIESAISRKYQ